MTIHDTLQRKITNWTVRVGVFVAGLAFAVMMFLLVGGFE